VPDDVPYCTGAIGLLGTKPSWDMMQEADTLLMVGSGFPYSNFLPKPGQARGVQIDRAARMLSLRYPMEVNLCGDSRATLRELMPMLRRKEDRSFQEKLVKEVADWWRLMDDRAQPEDHDHGLRPQALFAAISRRLPDGAVLTSDSGSAANWFARHVRTRRGMKATLSGNLATMLPGVPYAIAGKFAFPDRVSVAMVGDGAMQMGGMAEMLTAAKYYDTWADPRLIVLVLNNEDLNQVTWEQRVMEGDPRFDASQRIPGVRFHEFAQMIGLRGIRIERSSEIEAAMDQAFAADRPVIIDAVTDPEEAPLPPHITFKQARAFARSVLKDPSDGMSGALQAVREKVDEFVPGR
jgi:pyruvate dehydrogenase (quinone)